MTIEAEGSWAYVSPSLNSLGSGYRRSEVGGIKGGGGVSRAQSLFGDRRRGLSLVTAWHAMAKERQKMLMVVVVSTMAREEEL